MPGAEDVQEAEEAKITFRHRELFISLIEGKTKKGGCKIQENEEAPFSSFLSEP